MGAQQRVFRRKIRSVESTKKITKAMELIAASRILKAQSRLEAARPYTRELVRALSAAASNLSATEEHPLTSQGRLEDRAAVLLLTSDRGLAGAYSSAAIKEGEQLSSLLRERGMEVVPYLVGRKAVNYYRFRSRPVAGEWVGFTESPTPEHAKEIAAALLERFMTATEDGGADEIHIVGTQFISTGVQVPLVTRVLPLEVVEEEVGTTSAEGETTVFPLYDFEPDAAGVLDALLPRYVENVVYTALLNAAASELAARRRAMKSASDNAEEIIKTYKRQANKARQAEITQEISEIVGGADALASASAGSE